MKVLLIEDDMCAASTLAKQLKNNHIHCDICYYGKEGLDLLSSSNYDMLLVDLKLPDINGQEVVRQIRLSSKKDIAIVVISSFCDINTKHQLFNSGVDEYIIKPFATDELIMRLYAIFRRTRGYTTNKIYIYPGMCIDIAAKVITINDKVLELTATEFMLMEFLGTHKDHVLTKDVLIDNLYYKNFNNTPTLKIVDVLICKIRTKIRNLTNSNINYIHTKWGVGYCVKSHNEDNYEAIEEISLV